METHVEIDGIINEWVFYNGVIWGVITGDRKERFYDGARIHTSLVVEANTPELAEGTIVEIRSTYSASRGPRCRGPSCHGHLTVELIIIILRVRIHYQP